MSIITDDSISSLPLVVSIATVWSANLHSAPSLLTYSILSCNSSVMGCPSSIGSMVQSLMEPLLATPTIVGLLHSSIIDSSSFFSQTTPGRQSLMVTEEHVNNNNETMYMYSGTSLPIRTLIGYGGLGVLPTQLLYCITHV